MDELYPGADQKEPMRRMKAAGTNLTWDIFDGVGHDRSDTIDRDRKFVTGWLSEQTRNPLPALVDLGMSDPKRHGRCYWIRAKSLTHWEHDPFTDEELSWPVTGDEPKRPMFGFVNDEAFKGDGVRVAQVALYSGAKEAGLEAGDVIQTIRGGAVSRFADVDPILKGLQSGKFVDFEVIRNDKKVMLEIPYRPLTISPKLRLEDAGRIEAKRKDNTIWTRSKRVGAFDILISPDAFDLSKEIVVLFKGSERFRGIVTPDTKVMLEEMRDRHGDITVPYVARIPIVIDPKSVK